MGKVMTAVNQSTVILPGSGWIDEFKLSSAVLEPDEAFASHEFLRLDLHVPGGPLPWFDITAMSERLKVEPSEVRKAIEDNTRH